LIGADNLIYQRIYIRNVPDELSRLIEIEQAQEVLQQTARCQARMINWSLQLARAESSDSGNSVKEEVKMSPEGIRQIAVSPSDFHSRLRTALLANLNRSIVELYQLCDEEEDISVCLDAISLFERGGRDFKVLSDRLSDRRNAGLDQKSVGTSRA
jgi:S phase cyclin A-associated protein in the endoplasmic reticulum